MSKTLCFQRRGMGSITGRGTKILHAAQNSQKNSQSTVVSFQASLRPCWGQVSWHPSVSSANTDSATPLRAQLHVLLGGTP